MIRITTNKLRTACILAVGLMIFVSAAGTVLIGAPDDKPQVNRPQPVDDDMHHFMEYVFEPNYHRLRAEMAKPQRDKAAWKEIKQDALTLAECANLLLMRAPDEKPGKWRSLSVAVRTQGSDLYQAARKSDEAAARGAYTKMLESCNACHQQFADGEHQLQP